MEAPAARTVSLWSLIAGAEASNWSRLLIRDHLDPAARLAVFHTCRDGRDLLLVEATSAVIQLTLTDQSGDPSASMASVQAAKSALLTRRNLCTKLHLTADTAWMLSLAQGLLGETTWLGKLVLELPPDQPLHPSLLAVSARTCPNLKALMVNGKVQALPSPELFPKLDLLKFDTHPDNEEQIMRSAAPYLPRLRGLRVTRGAKQGPELRLAHLSLLLNPTNPGTLLQGLSICATLDDALLGLLLECAPNLTNLRVRSLRVLHDAHVQAKTRWQELRVEDVVVLGSLARLPSAPSLGVILGNTKGLGVTCDVTTAQGVNDVRTALLSRYKAVSLLHRGAGVSVGLAPPRGMEAADQPIALRTGISLLQACCITTPPNPSIVLCRWHMSSALILELSRLPSWSAVEFSATLQWQPQPQLYTTLLRLLPGSFREVRLCPHAELTRTVIESICLGAPVSQAPDAPPFDIKLRCAAEVVEAVQHKVQSLGVFPNVVISRF